MKTKTIEKILLAKFTKFLDSIKNEEVKNLVKKNSIITGGSISSMYLKEKVNDYDIYFTNKETVLSVTKYYLDIFNEKNQTSGKIIDGDSFEGEQVYKLTKDRVYILFESYGVMKEKGLQEEDIHNLGDTIEIKDVEGEKYRPVFLSSNAITLSCEIQIIIRFYGNAKTIHDNYDFSHCTNYWTSKDEQLIINQKALECLLSKELYYIGSKYPLASIIRVRKFVQRGWLINAGQILKMCLQLNELDLKDINVLKDQLVGVDLALFGSLIDALENIPNPNEPLIYEYISAIIDKIF